MRITKKVFDEKVKSILSGIPEEFHEFLIDLTWTPYVDIYECRRQTLEKLPDIATDFYVCYCKRNNRLIKIFALSL